MKVLFATPEFAPLVKTGGLGDVSAALPRALRALGHDVRVLMPAYGGMASLGTLQRVISLPAWEGWPAAQLLHTVAALPADVSVLLIEHDMDLVFEFADRITVLVNGAVLTEGTPEAIAADPQVKAVYLGHGEAIHG